MEFYLVCLILGFLGMAFMAVGGLGHGHGGHGNGGHVGPGGHGGHSGDFNLHGAAGHAPALPAAGHAGPIGHAAPVGHAGPVAHAAHGGHAAHGHAHGDAGGSDGRALMLAGLGNLVSPRVVSSVAFGVGAGGLLAHPYLGEPLVFGVALLAGVGLEALVMRPLWNVMMGFASNPAMMLDSAVMDTAQAVSSFNARGEGLISLELDGQVRQLLGVLAPVDVQAGVRVKAGDRVLIEAVDPERNRCTVSYLGS
ncbi:MAG: hypothetical protein JWM27_1742 [Gemmatimonadetes bacterium]|nr:hypothetical protein [Gemmatimonadota bacterium]